MFQVGKLYHRQTELHDKYGGNRQSGIASSGSHPYIFLFNSPRGEEFGYKDGWISKDEYRYTGEGQLGDMAMVRGNRAILEHSVGGKELHLFEKQDKGLYEYIGQFEYVMHETKEGPDGLGQQRQIITFTLKRC